jgi:sirohydrochlorin cobaltochelatase
MSTLTGSQISDPRPKGGVEQRPGVILVAHGSARSAASAEPVLALAESLRDRGFPEVRSAFWKEEPFLHQALEITRCGTVAVLPIFLSEGYFSNTVVPRELGLRYGDNRIGERWIRLLPPLGAEAGLADIVAARAREGVPPGADTSESLLVVLGHGTQRDPASGDAVLDVCASISRGKQFARVAPAFIDQEPLLESVVKDAREPVILLVPFLVAAGWHGGTTVPHELDRDALGSLHGERRIVYTEPVGTHPALVDLAEAILLRAELPLKPSRGGSALPVLTRLEPFLEDRLAHSTTAELMQVMIRVEDRTVYELRHVDDEEVDPEHLTEIATANALGNFTRCSDDGGQRPLRTAADLPRGWRLRAAHIRDVVEALVEVYGSALVHWHLGELGELSGVSFREATRGQSGIYSALAQVETRGIQAGTSRVCDGLPCLRSRLWGVEDTVTMVKGRHDETGRQLVVPCPRPCPSLFTGVLGLVAERKSFDAAQQRRGVDDQPTLG